MLATTFREQARKWRPLARDHVRRVIIAVHRFICKLLVEVVPEDHMREELWECFLLERLLSAYQEAYKHADFLLHIELQGRPTTYNDLFSRALQAAQASRLRRDVLTKGGKPMGGSSMFGAPSAQQQMISLDSLSALTVDKTNAEHVKEAIHDILESYYNVARKRFVEVLVQQVIDHTLLSGDRSPLRVLCPSLISDMSDEELDMIAGEDAVTRQKRRALQKEEKEWLQAVKVLRG